MRKITSMLRSTLLFAAVLLPSFVFAQEGTLSIKVGETQVPVVGSETVRVQHPAKTAYAAKIATFDKLAACDALHVDELAGEGFASYILNLTTNEAVENTTDGWRSAEGDALTWGSAEGMVCVKIGDPASSVIDYIGAIDETHEAGTSVSTAWTFVSGDTAAYIVNVELNFIAAPTSIKVGEDNVPVAETLTSTVDVFEKVAYTGDQGSFDVAKVCEILGIESISAAQQYIVDPYTTSAVTNNSDGWRDPVGAAAGWGTSPMQVCVKINEPESGLIDYVGAIDDRYVAGMTYSAYWAFVANGKAALIETIVNFIVDPASLVQIPETELEVAKVQVLKTAEVSTDRYATNGYETTDVKLTITDLASTLGIENKEDLASVFANQIYVIGEDSIQCESKNLQLLTVSDGWLSQSVLNFDGEAGDPMDYCIGAMYSGNSKYFVQKMAYDAETDEVSFVVGQYPGNLKTGEQWPVNLYVMWGDKAYVIKHTLNIVAPETVGFDGLEQVGETIELTYEQYPTTDFSAVSVLVDMDAVAESLGCEVGEISLKALADEDGFTTATTANNGGWWFDPEGYVTSYGANSAFFIEPAEAGNYAFLNMGQMPGVLAAEQSVATDLYLVYNNKYVKLHVTLNVVEKEMGETDEWVSVATRNFTIQQEVAEYTWSTQVASINNAELIELIGTTSPTLYCATAPESEYAYDDNYTMGEKPGFWLTAEGYVTGWNVDSPWGMTSQASTTGITDGWGFKCIQFPGCSVGDTFSGVFYLVNTENGKMITVHLNYQVVSEIQEAEIVGTDKIAVSVGGDDFAEDYDLTPIAEAIGFASLDDMNNASYVMFGLTAAGVYSDPVPTSAWLYLDENGAACGEEDAKIFIYFENGQVNVTTNDFTPEAGWQRNIEVYFEHPETGKRFVLEVALMNAEDYTAISAVKAVKSSNALYDLSGRKVVKAQKGIYITNGKKVVK